MNLFQQLLSWLQGPPSSAAGPAPTIGDKLLAYGKQLLATAQAKASQANASAPPSNAPGATNQKSEAPAGQSLADLFAQYNKWGFGQHSIVKAGVEAR